MTYYEVLDISLSATPEQIRKAYRELVEIYHPDRMEDRRADVKERAESRLKLINEAYAVLRDPEERLRYDRALNEENGQGSIYFKPKGSSSVARSRIRQRLAEIGQALQADKAEIERLTPQLANQPLLDQQWDRYILVSFVLGWPFILFGVWISPTVWSNILSTAAFSSLLLLTLLGYICLIAVSFASQSRLRDISIRRLLASAPLAVLLFIGGILLRLGRGFHVAILLLGYVGLLWQTIGKPLAVKRSKVLVAGSKIKQLEEEILAYEMEKKHLETQLSRS